MGGDGGDGVRCKSVLSLMVVVIILCDCGHLTILVRIVDGDAAPHKVAIHRLYRGNMMGGRF